MQLSPGARPTAAACPNHRPHDCHAYAPLRGLHVRPSEGHPADVRGGHAVRVPGCQRQVSRQSFQDAGRGDCVDTLRRAISADGRASRTARRAGPLQDPKVRTADGQVVFDGSDDRLQFCCGSVFAPRSDHFDCVPGAARRRIARRAPARRIRRMAACTGNCHRISSGS